MHPLTHTCTICGYDGLDEPPADWSICPSCGTQFGYDDASTTHEELRNRWLKAGAKWWSPNTPAPPGWDADAQLQRAGIVSERAA